jgi:hypothetical protein
MAPRACVVRLVEDGRAACDARDVGASDAEIVELPVLVCHELAVDTPLLAPRLAGGIQPRADCGPPAPRHGNGRLVMARVDRLGDQRDVLPLDADVRQYPIAAAHQGVVGLAPFLPAGQPRQHGARRSPRASSGPHRHWRGSLGTKLLGARCVMVDLGVAQGGGDPPGPRVVQGALWIHGATSFHPMDRGSR